MKWALYLLFLPLLTFAQESPSKGVNRIVVGNTNTAFENYKLIIPVLLDAGYQIEKRDDEYRTVQTQYRLIKGKAVNVQFNFIAKDSAIIVSGTSISTVGISTYSANLPYQIEYRGMKGSEIRNAFEAMNGVAAKLGGQLSFEKK